MRKYLILILSLAVFVSCSNNESGSVHATNNNNAAELQKIEAEKQKLEQERQKLEEEKLRQAEEEKNTVYELRFKTQQENRV